MKDILVSVLALYCMILNFGHVGVGTDLLTCLIPLLLLLGFLFSIPFLYNAA